MRQPLLFPLKKGVFSLLATGVLLWLIGGGFDPAFALKPIGGGSASSNTGRPVIVSFTAAPASIIVGAGATLRWSVTGATRLSIDNGVGIVTGTSRAVNPATTTTYTLTATNSKGSVTATTRVTVVSGYVLTVTMGNGVTGTPSASQNYSPGSVVNYTYHLQAGYNNLQVTLDGQPAAASGSVIMNASHTLTVTASSGNTDLIPADRRTTWNPGIPGGIPSVTTVYTTISAATYGNGVTDATNAINTAIQNAGDRAASTGIRQVVYLPAGTYRTTDIINLNRSDVVLRGAGPSLTKIVSESPSWVMGMGRIWPDYPESAALNVTASINKGSNVFQLANADAAIFQVGDVVTIDQQDPLPATLGNDGIHYFNGYVWLGDGQYFKRQPTVDTNGPGTGGIPWWDDGSGRWVYISNYNARYTGPWRSVGQTVEITGKSVGPVYTTFTIRNQFHIAFPLTRVPQVWHSGTRWTATRNMPGTWYAGVEDLYLTGGDNIGIHGWNLSYCWLKSVEVDGRRVAGDSRHPGIGGPLIEMGLSYHCEIRHSYVHHSRRMINNAGSYGVLFSDHSSDNLIEDNIVMWLCKPVMFNCSGGGNVVGYNYVDNAIIMGTDWQENAIDSHECFSHFDLVEGNWTPNLGVDSTHGNNGWQTYFRNYATGQNSGTYDIGGGVTGRTGSNLRAAGADAWMGPQNFVGNVLIGVDNGMGLVYEINSGYHPWGYSCVYRFGGGGDGGDGDVYDDGTAAANTYRHGNWDNINNGVVWDPSNANHTLPNSLYLSQKPSFFGSLAWPWVDPTTVTRVQILPAKKRFDDGDPFAAAP